MSPGDVAASRRNALSPLIGVVVPVYGHSGLVAEAVASLAAQENAPPFAIALVNDGCAFEETDLIGSTLHSWGLPWTHYIRRVNGGLSAARNTGIDFLLKRYESLAAIYLLDADNRLEPYALANLAAALQDDPDAGWFYPDIEMFGLKAVHEYGGEYNGLAHTHTNISEAGSLIRRAVFEAGVRFDETMRQGYEDWEFWLSASEKGFVGRHLPGIGFCYRKRPESMLSDSHRDDAQLRAYIRHKHKGLYKPKRLVALEAAQAPRYAVLTDDDTVLLAVDPARPAETITIAEFESRFWRWMLRPDLHFTSPFIAYCEREVLDYLVERGLLHWVFWDLEQSLRESHVAAMRLQRWGQQAVGIGTRDVGASCPPTAVHVAMVTADLARKIAKDTSLAWWNGLLIGNAGVNMDTRIVSMPDRGAELLPVEAKHGIFWAVARLAQSRYRAALDQAWKWAGSGVPDRQQAYLAVRSSVDGGVVYPRAPDGRRHVAFVMAHADFGGVEKVAYNVAQQLKALGYVAHLVLFQQSEIRLPPEFSDVFESLNWVTQAGMMRWTGDLFNGTRLSWWSQHGDKHEVIGLLSTFDVVVNCSSSDAYGVAGDLRRRGVTTVAHQHVVEHSHSGLPGGNAALARAFEHSYELIVTCSHQLLDWFVANGLPRGKLTVVENAPSYPVLASQLANIGKERERNIQEGAPLKLLFLGRLDVQKGLDRLLEVVLSTADSPDLLWRVVGKSIVEQDSAVGSLSKLVTIEPPVYTSSGLTDLYAWADVILMPSRYEGVPLTILEAMRCGVIVIAAQAGAIDEVLTDRIDGFLVSQDNCAQEMLAVISQIQHDPDLRRKISRNAMSRAEMRSWESNVQPLAMALDRLLKAKDKKPPSAQAVPSLADLEPARGALTV